MQALFLKEMVVHGRDIVKKIISLYAFVGATLFPIFLS